MTLTQYAATLHRDYKLSVRDISAEQFAVQRLNPPREPNMIYRVDGVVYQWDGAAWVNIPIVSPDPPDDNDNRPDGTIYIQTVS